LNDIYGGSAYLDFTLIVALIQTSSTDARNCFNDTNVVPSGFADDTLYVIGTMKQVKLNFMLP